jgi:hypothetical protein
VEDKLEVPSINLKLLSRRSESMEIAVEEEAF